MTIAIALYIETIDEYAGAPGQISLVQAWAEADREPGLRELPAWLDVDAVTRGFLGLLDGLFLQRIEAGSAYRPGELQRRAGAILELMLAAAGAPRPSVPVTPGPAGAVEPAGAISTA